MINYYSILELPEDASEEDIQAAYRKLARTMHPDKDPKKHRDIDPSATGKFRDVIEAYKILRDPIKKEKHDRDLHNTVKVSARKRRGSDVQVHLTVRADDIIIESLKYISTIRNGLCLSCNGTGTEARILSKCPKCNGSGIDVV